MVSICLNEECKKEILFGNIQRIEFCSEECEMKHDEKMTNLSGEYHLRHKQGHCRHCGSSKLKLTDGPIDTIKQQINLETQQSIYVHFTIEKHLCQICKKTTTDMIQRKQLPRENRIPWTLSDKTLKLAEELKIKYTGFVQFLNGYYFIAWENRCNAWICSDLNCLKTEFEDAINSKYELGIHHTKDCKDPDFCQCPDNSIPLTTYLNEGALGAIELHVECARKYGILEKLKPKFKSKSEKKEQ